MLALLCGVAAATDVRVLVTGHRVCPAAVARHFADLDGVDVAFVHADSPFVDDVRVSVDAVCADGRQITCRARDVYLERACERASDRARRCLRHRSVVTHGTLATRSSFCADRSGP